MILNLRGPFDSLSSNSSSFSVTGLSTTSSSARCSMSHGVALTLFASSRLQRSSIGRLITARDVTTPSSVPRTYELESRLYPRNTALFQRGPMLPSASCCGPLIGNLYKHDSTKPISLCLNGRPLARAHAVRPSSPRTVAFMMKHTCLVIHAIKGWPTGISTPSLFSRHLFKVR